MRRTTGWVLTSRDDGIDQSRRTCLGCANLGPGDVILLSEVEHHSNIVPWQMLADDVGCDLRYLPLNPSTGQIDPTDLDVAMEGVRLISIIHTERPRHQKSPSRT